MCDHRHLEDKSSESKNRSIEEQENDGKRPMFNTEEAFWSGRCTVNYEKLMSTGNAIPWKICANVFLNCILSALNIKCSQRPNPSEKYKNYYTKRNCLRLCHARQQFWKDVWLSVFLNFAFWLRHLQYFILK